MKYLRIRNIVAIKIKPKDSKAKDFHTALADYLHKELKYQGLNVKRHNINLKIKLEKLHQDKYDHIVIDCHAGKIFLRGKEVKDKFFGRLRRFEGSRPADAYHCVAQSATRIVNRINKLMNDLLDDDDEREIYGEEIQRLDLRKQAAYETWDGGRTDIGTRRAAICYINGELYESPRTHAACINEYLQDNHLGKLRNLYHRPYISDQQSTEYSEEELEDMLDSMSDKEYDEYIIAENIQSLAFAHKINNYTINLETDTLYNVDLNTVIKLIKQEYPGCTIYNDNQYDDVRQTFKKLAKDLRKKARSDIWDREFALLYADGEIIKADTHAKCFDIYFEEHGINCWMQDTTFRPAIFDDEPEPYSDEENIRKHIKSIGFAHYINDDEIRIETNTLYNLSLQTFTAALKKEYPKAKIYDDCVYDNVNGFKRIAKDLRRKKIKIVKDHRKIAKKFFNNDYEPIFNKIDKRRIKNNIQDCRKLAYTTPKYRNSAILYINGEFIEGTQHNQCMEQYNAKNPGVDTDNIPIAFAHKIDDNTINLDTTSLFNIDINTIINKLKLEYPGYKIFDDCNYDEVKGYKRLAKYYLK